MRTGRLLLLFAIALAPCLATIWVETCKLRLNRQITKLQHERELLAERHRLLRLEAARLAAPQRLIELAADGQEPLVPPERPDRRAGRSWNLLPHRGQLSGCTSQHRPDQQLARFVAMLRRSGCGPAL